MRLKLPPHVHHKRAKGKHYFYFDTGKVDPKGKRIFARLPDIASGGFWRAVEGHQARREEREDVEAAMTVPALVERYRRSTRFAKLADNSKRSYNACLDTIADLLDTQIAADTTRKIAADLHDSLADTPGMANQVIRVMGALFAWAVKNDLAPLNPTVGVELFEGGEHQPWPEGLLEKALNADDPQVRLATRLLYYTAQRIGDACRMRWSDIKDGAIEVVQEKTDTELFIPLHTDLQATLAAMPRNLTTIIAQADGRPHEPRTVRKWLQDFAKGQGAKVVPHGLRKNAVNALLEAGCTVAQTAAISGQSLQLVEYYARRRDKKKLAKAAMRIWESGR